MDKGVYINILGKPSKNIGGKRKNEEIKAKESKISIKN